MLGTLKYNREWLVTQNGQDRAFLIHPEQQEDMHLFDIHQEYPVDYSLCYIVELKLYCVRISKSSFPKPPIVKTLLENMTNIEVIDGDESFYIGNNLVIELAYVDGTLKLFISKKQ